MLIPSFTAGRQNSDDFIFDESGMSAIARQGAGHLAAINLGIGI